MFFYFPVKQPDGAVLGRVRVENGRAALTLFRPHPAEATLFADGRALPIRPDEAVPALMPEGVIGVANGRLAYFGLAPGAGVTPEQLLFRLSQNQPRIPEEPTVPAPSPANPPDPSPAEPPAPAPAPQEPPAESDEQATILHQEEPPAAAESDTPEPSAQSGEFAEESMYMYALSVFSRLLALDPDPADDAEAIPKKGYAVDNPVDNVDNTAEIMGQIKDKRPDWMQKAIAAAHAGHDKMHEETGDPALCALSNAASGARRPVLFARIFPGASWRFVADGPYPPHYEGDWSHGGKRFRILAVRGAYAKQPPQGLRGFTRYLRGESGGYWVRLIPFGKDIS